MAAGALSSQTSIGHCGDMGPSVDPSSVHVSHVESHQVHDPLVPKGSIALKDVVVRGNQRGSRAAGLALEVKVKLDWVDDPSAHNCS